MTGFDRKCSTGLKWANNARAMVNIIKHDGVGMDHKSWQYIHFLNKNHSIVTKLKSKKCKLP